MLVVGMFEDGAGVQQRLEVEYVVDGGRRPHVSLHSKTSGRQPDYNEAGPPQGHSLTRSDAKGHGGNGGKPRAARTGLNDRLWAGHAPSRERAL
jgi:hypothetical protein